MRKIRSAAALAAASLIFLTAACGETAGTAHSGGAADDETAVTEAEETETEARSNVPDDVRFDGQTFTLLSANYKEYHWSLVEELNGEVLNDAIFNMAADAEQKLGCEITEVQQDIWEIQKTLQKMTAAGDDTYDAAGYSGRFATFCMLDGSLQPLENAKYIDLTSPWWLPEISKSLSMNGKTYFTVGDYNILSHNYTMAMLFNSKMAGDFGHSSAEMYDSVDAGKWTYDRLRSMMSEVTSDLDGDGKMTESDRYGLTSFYKTCSFGTTTVLSCGETVVGIVDGAPALTWDNPRVADIIELAYNIVHSDDVYLGAAGYTADSFVGGRSLFLSTFFMGVSYLVNMEDDYGIIPCPKYDEAQAAYYNPTIDPIYTLIPITCRDPQFSGAVLDTMAFNGHNSVVGAYRDVTLKYKRSRDDITPRMVDLIFDNRVVDIGSTYLYDTCGYDYIYLNVLDKKDLNWASYIEKNTKKTEKALGELLEFIG